MSSCNYEPPVATLLDLGELEFNTPWYNYPQQYGLDTSHIPDLIRMATDLERLSEGYAPVHAWRALGQLQATEAIKPLLGLFDLDLHDDWIHQDMPQVIGWIGASAIPEVQTFLEDSSHDEIAYICAMESFQHIVQHNPLLRGDCMNVLKQRLEEFEQNTPSINGFLIAASLDLKAVELAPLMKQAFEAKCVDFQVVGDWDEVQVELGLKSRREVPLKRFTATEAVEMTAAQKKDLKQFMRFGSGRGFSTTKSPPNPSKSQKKKKR